MAFVMKERFVWQERTGNEGVAVWVCASRAWFRKQISRKQCGSISHEPPKAPVSPHLLPAREELRSLFQARAKLSPVCRAVAGLEGTSQQALQRNCAVRRAFASGFAALKRKAPCSQIKLQMVSGFPVRIQLRPSLLHIPPRFHHLPSPVGLEVQASPHTTQRRKPRLRTAKKPGHGHTTGK